MLFRSGCGDKTDCPIGARFLELISRVGQISWGWEEGQRIWQRALGDGATWPPRNGGGNAGKYQAVLFHPWATL